MNKRQIKKQFKILCNKYGTHISDTYTDGRMTKEETRRVRQSLASIKVVMKVALSIVKVNPKINYDLRTKPDLAYEKELNQFLQKQITILPSNPQILEKGVYGIADKC